ncbi:MAG: helix-turn-helix domain-containing protein [Pseudomonadota bacterium]
MSEPLKPTYAAIPLRALQDPALSGADIRTLGAVAAFDRFAKNCTGCFASYQKIAQIAGLAIETLKRSVAKLIELGYLRSEANPMDARRRILFVEYTEADAAAMRGDGRSFTKPARLKLAPAPEIGDQMVTKNMVAARPVENLRRPKVGDETVTDSGEIGDRRKCQPVDSVDRSERNIFCEADKRLGEALEAREKAVNAAPPGVMADAERAARDAISGRIDVGEGVDRLRRIIGRMRSYGDIAGERRAVAMVDAVIADAPRREPRPARGPLASPIEMQAIREARERGEPPPGWVRPEVRGAA